MIRQKDLGTTENMINNQANGVGNGLFNDRFFTIKEAAKRWNIGESTLRRHISRGLIKTTRIGGQIRLPQRRLEEYMASSSSESKVNIVEYTQPAKCKLPEEVLNSKHLTVVK